MYQNTNYNIIINYHRYQFVEDVFVRILKLPKHCAVLYHKWAKKEKYILEKTIIVSRDCNNMDVVEKILSIKQLISFSNFTIIILLYRYHLIYRH